MAITKLKSKQQFSVTDNLSFSNVYRINNLLDPINSQDAATKSYVDANSSGLIVKTAARAATVGTETYTISGGAVTQINGTAIDGVTLSTLERLLIKNAPASTGIGSTTNTIQPSNGIYEITGTVGGNLQVVRAGDAGVGDIEGGMFLFVTEGTNGGDNGFVLVTNSPISVNTTPLQFTQFSGAGQIDAGDGLTKSGNTINAVGTASRISVSANAIDIDSGYVGQTSIVTLGTVTTGTWNATTIAIARGGTGITSTPSNGQLLIGNGTGYTLATLNAGSGISITNGAGSISIAVTGVLTSSNFVVREIPSGTINGTNPTFTLAFTPTAGTEMIFVNGILQNAGAGNDYTISSTTITFLSGAIPQTGDTVLVSYLK